MNDPQAKEVTADEVTCKRCDQRIALTDGKDFDESKWEQHKAECTEYVGSSFLGSVVH